MDFLFLLNSLPISRILYPPENIANYHEFYEQRARAWTRCRAKSSQLSLYAKQFVKS